MCRNPLAQGCFLYANINLALHTFGGCFSTLTRAQDGLDLHTTGALMVFLPSSVQIEPSGLISDNSTFAGGGTLSS